MLQSIPKVKKRRPNHGGDDRDGSGQYFPLGSGFEFFFILIDSGYRSIDIFLGQQILTSGPILFRHTDQIGGLLLSLLFITTDSVPSTRGALLCAENFKLDF